MMMLEFTILGCGFSGGVPRADGTWGKCDPAEPRNHRSRCSFMVRRGEGPGLLPEHATTLIVDTSPDLRLQAVAAGVRRLDAVVLTHDHADQSHGIDDVRGFFMRQGGPIPVYMDAECGRSMRQRFGYVFEGIGGYPAIAEARPAPPHGQPWSVDGPGGPIPIIGFDQDHGEVRSLGLRFGDVAYCSDVLDFPDESWPMLEGLDVFVVDALRVAPHPSHAHLDKTLGWIEKLRPKRAILTNLHNEFDYNALSARLPAGVEAAFDGMRFTAAI
jgi:phosphoribosyl 1,2-cyclic phosphate phosphodiesterase